MKNSDLSAEPEETQRVTQGTPIIVDAMVTIPLRWHRKKDGTTFPVEITGRFFERQGHPVHIAAIRDISQRRQHQEQLEKALAEKETLLRELYHRTKNNMQMIIALLDLQSAEFEDKKLKEAFTAAQNRIHSMSLVHQNLYKTRDLSHVNLKAYIDDLADLLIGNFQVGVNSVTLTAEMEDVEVLIDTAIPCGLVLNELITNAFKYAFPPGRQGEIRIGLRQSPSGEIFLRVTDDGIGPRPGYDFRRDGGFGSQILFTLVEDQLGGKVSFDLSHGVDCQISFHDNSNQPRV